jgi:hypothetical protein
MILTLYFAALVVGLPSPSPAPHPSSTPLREIGSVRTDAACSSLVSLVLPVGRVAAANDRAFNEIKDHLTKFSAADSVMQGDGSNPLPSKPQVQQPQARSSPSTESASDQIGTTHLATVGGTQHAIDNGTAESPERTLSAANIDRLVGIILHNLDDADKAMAASWKAHPEHLDPALNAIRQRVQNIIDMQRVLAFRLDDVAATYFAGAPVPSLDLQNDHVPYKAALESIATELAADRIAASQPQARALPGPKVAGVVALKREDAAEVLATLRVQEFALTIEVPQLVRACHPPAGPSP